MAVGIKTIGSGRKKGKQNKFTEAVKQNSVRFFEKLLDDETEAKFWRYFMTGYVVDVQADGAERIIPIPLNPVAFAAFKRAVEYKRGMPVITTKVGGTDGNAIAIRFEAVGAKPEDFAAQARAIGLVS